MDVSLHKKSSMKHWVLFIGHAAAVMCASSPLLTEAWFSLSMWVTLGLLAGLRGLSRSIEVTACSRDINRLRLSVERMESLIRSVIGKEGSNG